MEGKEAFLSKTDGKIKLEYKSNNDSRIKLWETLEDMTLETTFDSNGLVLLQNLYEFDEKNVEYRIREVMRESGISKLSEGEYSEVKIMKLCPNCNERSLQRFVEAFRSRNELPIVPIYYCQKCRTKSYHLTNQYLEYLVENNRNLFAESEISELERDKAAFMDEIREYIIRMFASKKIINIK